MKLKLLILFFILVSVVGASATDVLYVVRVNSDPVIVNELNVAGLSFDVKRDNELSGVNFNNYKAVLIDDNFIDLSRIPINSKNILAITSIYVEDLGFSEPVTVFTSSTPLDARIVTSNIVSQGLSNSFTVYTSAIDSNSINLPMYGLPRIPDRSFDLVNVIGSNTFDKNPIVGTIDVGDRLYPSGTSNTRRLFFGVTKTQFWSTSSKQLFRNSLNWVLNGGDDDNDGFRDDVDNCPVVSNPSQADLDNDDIGNACDSDADGDNTDVIQDCNDLDSNINPNAQEIIDNIDQNCRNDAPVLTSNFGDLSWDEDTVQTGDLLEDHFADPEGNALTYTSTGNVQVRVNFVGGRVTFTPDNDFTGIENVRIVARDSPGLTTDSNQFRLQVLASTDLPRFGSTNIPNIEFDEDTRLDDAFDLDDYFTDPDNDPLVYTVEGNNQISVTIDSQHRVDFDSPDNFFGIENIVFKASDNDGSVQSNPVSVEVRSVDDVPVVIPIPDVAFDEDTRLDDAFDLDDFFTDPNNQLLTYTVTGNNLISVTIDSQNKVSFDSPDNFFGVENVVFKATDTENNFVESNSVKLEVISVDDPLVFSGTLPNKNLDEEETEVVFDLDDYFSDLDNTIVSYSLETNPSHLVVVIDSNNEVSLTAENEFEGSEILIFRALNDIGIMTSSNPVTVNIRRINEAPKIDRVTVSYDGITQDIPEGQFAIQENKIYVFSVEAHDDEGENVRIRYDFNITPNTYDARLIRDITLGRRECPQEVNCDLNYDRLIDAVDLQTAINFIPQIQLKRYGDINLDGVVNNDDVIIMNNIMFGRTFCPIDVDCDVDHNGRVDPLDAQRTSSLIGDFPDFDSSGHFVLPTDQRSVGVRLLTVRATDGPRTTIREIPLVIGNVNREPIFLRVNSDITMNEDSVTRSAFEISDPDGDSLTITIAQEENVDCEIKGNEVVITASNNYGGVGSCLMEVRDSRGSIVYRQYNIVVVPVNDVPIINSVTPIENDVSVRVNRDLLFNVDAQDVELNTLIVNWYVDDVNVHTGNDFVFISNIVGMHHVRVDVTDGFDVVSEHWNVDVLSGLVTRKFNGATTDFNNVDLSNIPNLVLEIVGLGKIEFQESVNLGNVDNIDDQVELSTTLVGTDLINLKDKDIIITLNNQAYGNTPVILRNSDFVTDPSLITQTCTNCQILDFTPAPTTNGVVRFRTEGFSTYRVGSATVIPPPGNDTNGTIPPPPPNNQTNTSTIGFCETGNVGHLSIKIEEPDDDDISIGSTVEFEIEVENDGDDDLDVEVEVTLVDLTENEDVKSVTSDEVSIDSDDKETINVEFEVPDDLDEGHRYEFVVKAVEDEDQECEAKDLDVNIEREDDLIVFDRFSVNPATVTCNEFVNVDIEFENIGKKDQDNVVIRLEQRELNVDLVSQEFEVESFDDDENDATVRFNFRVPEVESRDYTLTATIDYDGETTTESKTLSVRSCNTQGTISPSGSSNSISSTSRSTIEITPVIDEIEVRPGSSFVVPVRVENNGERFDGFLELQGLNSADSKKISLAKGEESTLYLSGIADDNLEVGEYRGVVALNDRGVVNAKDVVLKVVDEKPNNLNRNVGLFLGNLVLFLAIIFLIRRIRK